MLLEPCRNVHTIGMRFPIDVAYLGFSKKRDEFVVIRTRTMPANRLDRPVVRACAVLEANAGAFGSWGLVVGSSIVVTS